MQQSDYITQNIS